MFQLIATRSSQLPEWFHFQYFNVFILVSFPFCAWILGRVSGWKRMSHRFPAPKEALVGTKFAFVSGQIGWIVYRNVVFAQVTPYGLRLSIAFPFRIGHPPLLIPWTEITHVRLYTVLGVEALYFEVGTPTMAKIRMPAKLLAASPLAASAHGNVAANNRGTKE